MENFPNFYIQEDLPEVKHLGYGHAVIFNTLKRHSLRPLTRRGKGDFHVIISLCLLLSGDIHPYPGPGSVNIMTVVHPYHMLTGLIGWRLTT